MPASSPPPRQTDSPWPGCHGVRLVKNSSAEGYGSCLGDPLVEAELIEAPVGRPTGREIWHISADVQLPGGPIHVDQRLSLEDDGSFVLLADGSALRIEPGGRLTLDADRQTMARQLVTTYGLPLLLHRVKALVLHACSAVPPGAQNAVLVCGSSGAGKSTLLVALIAAGWRAVSEDLCVVDTRGKLPVVWPGPPWIRRDGDGPKDSRPRFQTAEKTAWDIAPWQVDRPVVVGRVVFLEHAGGTSIMREHVDRAAGVASLARMTAWLSEPSLRAAATFGPSVELAGAAPAMRLRLPVSADWTTDAEEILRED